MKLLPAAEQSLQNIGAVKNQVGDMLVRILGAEHPIGDAPGQDHIIAVQPVQDIRVSELVHGVDVHLVRLEIPDQPFHICHLVRRRNKYDDVDHDAFLSCGVL